MKKKYLFVFLAAAFFFWAAAQTRIGLTKSRERQNIALSDQSAGNPPLIVLTTVALGGFRGLVVDILWIRLISLQKEGKVFEIAQLADWITKLEPQFTAIWAFHAWNMAYNISILYANPEHRWLWVKNGIQLLRDNGLKYNPGEPVLYRELGWIYQHKVGQSWDDVHVYYKHKLAKEMDDLFRGPRPDYASLHSDTKKTQKMRAEYKLLPEIMQSIEQYYGQLDWRLPETHALYWAYRGLHSAAAGKDTSQCDHMICQSMAAEFMYGRLFINPDAGIYVPTPRLDLLPGTIKAYEDAIKRARVDYLRTAYVNFLSEAVFVLHAYGDDQNALKLFDKMLAVEPGLKTQMSPEKYLRKCDQLNITELPAAVAVAWIEGLLYQSHAVAPGVQAKNASGVRDKALLLWQQYTADRQNRKSSEILPDFEMLDQQALRRADALRVAH